MRRPFVYYTLVTSALVLYGEAVPEAEVRTRKNGGPKSQDLPRVTRMRRMNRSTLR